MDQGYSKKLEDLRVNFDSGLIKDSCPWFNEVVNQVIIT